MRKPAASCSIRDPRTITNLIVDQTVNNPAAYATAYDPGADGILRTADDVLKEGVQIVTSPAWTRPSARPTTPRSFSSRTSSPDVGLSAPFNAWFTFFGQFFDHGLDLVTKGGNGFIFIPLQPDDPLLTPGPMALRTRRDGPNFMVETRATMLPGPDGILGTADDIHEQQNTTTPFVDQNQTYTSSPSHQVFLREYAMGADGAPHATGRLITNRDLGADGKFGGGDDTDLGGMATWATVKAQARDLLGINLTDADVGNVPLLATDAYGNFIKGAHGFPQVVMQTAGTDGIFGTADDGTALVEGDPAAPIDLAHALRTGHQFLIDMAASANPFDPIDGHLLTPDADTVVNDHNAPPTPGVYDNELLDAHYIAGDGRANENIGLTAVHTIFHSEHNRLVAQTKAVLLTATSNRSGGRGGAAASLALLNSYLDQAHQLTALPTVPAGLDLTDVAAVNAFVDSLNLDWNGERLFQVARSAPRCSISTWCLRNSRAPWCRASTSSSRPTATTSPSIRRSSPNSPTPFSGSATRCCRRPLIACLLISGGSRSRHRDDRPDQQLGLIGAFLNPLEFAASGPTADQATGAIVRGLTREAGNEIDEFVTDAVRNNLLGTPLDLAALNIARGRDTGLPSLNAARRAFYHMTSQDQVAGDSSLTPYTSWADLRRAPQASRIDRSISSPPTAPTR